MNFIIRFIIVSFTIVYLLLFIACHKNPDPNIIIIDPKDTTKVYTPDPDSNLVLCNIYLPGDTTFGAIYARKNRQNFTSFIDAYKLRYENNVPIFMIRGGTYFYPNSLYLTESFHFVVPLNYEKQKLIITSSGKIGRTFYATKDDDSILDHYKLDTTQNNYFQFTKIDTLNKRLEGIFWVQFLIDMNPKAFYKDPDILRLSYGSFWVTKWD